MPDIRFTQYLYPNGNPHAQLIDRPEHIFRMAEKLRETGFVFEAKNKLQHVTIQIANRAAGYSVSDSCTNGPKVPAMIDGLVAYAFHRYIKTKGESLMPTDSKSTPGTLLGACFDIPTIKDLNEAAAAFHKVKDLLAQKFSAALLRAENDGEEALLRELWTAITGEEFGK